MRALVLSSAALLAMGSLAWAQDQTLRGVYGPPGLTPPAKSVGKSTLAPPNFDAVGNGPRVILDRKPAQGDILPSDVRPAPIPDRPGYGTATVNGRRTIIDLSNNRIFQILN
jgi:hypothetical protein